MLAVPDAATFELLPWADPEEPSGRIFCDIRNPDGTPFEGDPRWVMRRSLAMAADMGYTFYTAPEVEFFYFGHSDPDQPLVPLDNASYFDLDHRRCGQPAAQTHHRDAGGHGNPGGVLLP